MEERWCVLRTKKRDPGKMEKGAAGVSGIERRRRGGRRHLFLFPQGKLLRGGGVWGGKTPAAKEEIGAVVAVVRMSSGPGS